MKTQFLIFFLIAAGTLSVNFFYFCIYRVLVCGDETQKPFPLLVWNLASRKLLYDLRIPHHDFITSLAAITYEGHYVCCVAKVSKVFSIESQFCIRLRVAFNFQSELESIISLFRSFVFIDWIQISEFLVLYINLDLLKKCYDLDG